MMHEAVQRTIKMRDRPIKLDGGIDFNYAETIGMINAYRNRQFYEYDGDAIFWDLATHRAQHFAKNIDLDTRDLQPYSEGEASYLQVLVLRQKFYRWLENTRYALKLNETAEDLADFGSCVQKVYKQKGKPVVEICDLSRLYFDTTAKTIRETDLVEEHTMTVSELKKRKDVWDLSSLDIDKLEADQEFIIYEFTGEDDGVYKHGFIAEGKEEPLFEGEIKKEESMYYDYHIGNYKGRWLRQGVYERLFGLIERANILVNENIKTQRIASLLLLRTENPAFSGNVLTQAESGQIISDSTLQQVPMDNRAISAFIQEMQMIENQADRLAFTPEVITGDDLPSNTPFRSIATISSAAKSTFKMVREYYGEQLGYFLKENVFPDVVKGWNKEESIIMLRDEADVRYFDKQMKKLMRWKKTVNDMLDGKVVSEMDLKLVDQKYEEDIDTMQRKLKIPKDFFNFEYNIRTNITNEAENKQATNDAHFNAIQMVAANPALTQIPLFRQYLENNNISYWRLTPEQQAQLQANNTGGTGNAEAIGRGQDKLLAAANAQ